MTIKTSFWRGIGLGLLVLLGLGIHPAGSAEPESQEPASLVKHIDFDECDPITIRSKIMEVRADRGTLVVVEREVRDMDVEKGGRRIKTSYRNLAGQPATRDSFQPGQYVRVEGFLHPDGFIAAAMIQKTEKPVEKKKTYKPVELSKKRSRRIHTGSSAQ